MSEEQEGTPVAKVPNRSKVSTGKPSRIIKTGGMKFASFPSVGGTQMGAGGNFYSPELSTDFLELPQSLDEQRNYYRFFYRADPFVGQAIDLHTELPLSKLRLNIPKAENREMAQKSLDFCQGWAKDVGLLHRLIEIVHDYHLIGECFIFVEDASPDMPQDIRQEETRVFNEETKEVETHWSERLDADDRAVEWLKENYNGWTAIRILPPEQVHMESFPFTDERIVELIPDSKTKDLINQADMGDPNSKRVVDSMPEDVVNSIRNGQNISLNTDPEAGSFVYYMSRKKSQYEARGHSILERCIRTLVYRDKLRQAQTSIASRHMTPIRVIYAEGMDIQDVEELREQVDMSLQDPDYSIIANFEIRWEEMGADQRLLDLTSEYDLTDRQLYAGLGVTESLLSGESSYSGDRINLEVINTRYMLLRELLQDFVEQYIFKPMCARMGFVETDEDGVEKIIYPKLSFTRLALRDNSDTFDALFNLYQKGSLDIDIILELLNIDPETTNIKLQRDLFTLNDSSFNEVMRSIYSEVGRSLAENSDVAQKVAENMGLNYQEKDDGGSRF
tara:strand:- start:346 stop:2031 length:1686 start_codon:yes stop_codon:yes gene_type:complete